MAIIASDNFIDVGNGSSISGRTLNNALGGSGTRTFASNGTAALVGNGSGALVGGASAWSNVQPGQANFRATYYIDPNGATSAFQLTGRRTSPNANTPFYGARLAPGHTSIVLYEGDGTSSSPPSGTVRATQTMSAPGVPIYFQADFDGEQLTARIIRVSDSTELARVSYTFTAGLTGSYLAFGFAGNGDAGIIDSLVIEDVPTGDTTAPTLTSASASATSGTTSSGSVTTNENNGTLYWLTNTSSTATATAVKAGSSQSVTAAGSQSTSSTGLSPGTTYYTHFLHRDAAGNDSAVLSSASFATPAPDTTAPTFTGSITAGAKTSSSIALTLPTASDNVAVTGYQYRINGGAWVDNGNSTAVSITGLTALTSYTIDARAYDAASNYSTTLSVTTSTYRAGASAGSIVTATGPQDGNPAGILYALAQTLPVSDWISYYTVSGPTPTGGTLDAQANGAFSYTGPEPATWVIQPEVNGVAVEQITVTLYDQTVSEPTIASKQALSMRNGLGL